jgi:uncharacterized protein (DUF2384 family)
VTKAALQTQPSTIEETALGEAALSAFFSITRRWDLTAEEERRLLGMPARSTFFRWKKARQGQLSRDTLERVSYILGIYKALHILLPSAQAADAWLKKPNGAPLFQGRSALSKMLAGGVVDLADVRRYLDAERA